MKNSHSLQRLMGQRKLLPISLILLLASGLYLYQLGTENLWYDEFFSINKTQNGINLPPNNLTRPLYFILLYGWMAFSTDGVWLRLFSVIFGLASVLLIYLLGRKLAGEKVGLTAALLLTLSPLFINHAQEVRMYTLIPCLSLAGTLALTHALEKPTPVAINSWAIARLLALFTTPLTIPLFFPDLLLIGWNFRSQRRGLISFSLRLFFIACAWLPCFTAVQQSSSAFLKGWSVEYPKPNLILIVAELTHLTTFWPLRHLLGSGISANDLMAQVNQQPLVDWFLEHVLASNLFAIVFYMGFTAVAVAIIAIALVSGLSNPKLWWLKLWAILPIGSILVISYASSSIWRARYLLFASPYWLILLAVGFWQIWRWRRWFGFILIAIYGVAVTGGLVHYYTTLYRTFNGSPT